MPKMTGDQLVLQLLEIRPDIPIVLSTGYSEKITEEKAEALGSKGINQAEKELRVVGYCADGKDYWIATNRYDLSAEDVAQVYKLRWSIETFVGWWKRHLKVYQLIARSPYGLMVQITGGLITYLLPRAAWGEGLHQSSQRATHADSK